MIPVIVLAAGSSSRMRGRDKLLEEIDGVPLLRRQTQVARAVSDQVRVALPPAPHDRYAVIADLDVIPVPIPDANEGMGVSLRTAIGALPDGTARAMILLADLPDITADDLRAVTASVTRRPEAFIWRGATQDGKPGHPIIFDQSLFEGLKRLTGDSGGHEVVNGARKVHLVPLPGQRARLDLDTPEDWAAWRKTRS